MMNSQQQRFTNAYLVSNNATQSAIEAGYSAKTAKAQGSRLLTNVDIKEAIQQAQHEAGERNKITIDDVLSGLLSEAKGVHDSTASARIAAWAHIGRHLGMFVDKVENTHKLEIQSLSDLMDELTVGASN